MSYSKITGVILAGGKNSRMGQDKGMLLVDGKKIVERTIRVLKLFVHQIMIISNGKNYDYLGYKVLNDIVKDAGPMGGIHTALTRCETDKVLVVSCDMPFVSTEVISELVLRAGEGEVVIPVHGREETEPLCAIYSKSCLSRFDERLRSGQWKLRDSLDYFKVKKVIFPQNGLSKNWFMNVNTPQEYQSLTRSAHEYSN